MDLETLSKLADTMVRTSCRFSLEDGGSLAYKKRPIVIGLVGTLGAGKTRFCQEIAKAFGLPPGEVTSPTFTLVRTYEIPPPGHTSLPDDTRLPSDTRLQRDGMPHRWHHLDLYRVADEDELWELGIEELWDEPGAWTVMEWADLYAAQMPQHTVWIEVALPDDGATDTRDICVYCLDDGLAGWWMSIAEQMKSAKKA